MFSVSYAYNFHFNLLASNFLFSYPSAQQAANVKQTPSKKTLALCTSDGVIITEPNKIDKSQQKDSSKNGNVNRSGRAAKIGSDSREKTEVTGKVLDLQNNESRPFVNDVFATSTLSTSTPVIKKRVSLQSTPMTPVNLSKSNLNFSKSTDAKFNFSEARQQRESNFSLKVEVSDSVRSFNMTSPNSRSVDIVLTDSNRTVSPCNNSFPTLARDQPSSWNASFLSQNCNQSECTENSSHTSGSSVKSDIQLSSSPLLLNRCLNPISPLYSQSMAEKPKKYQKLQNKSSERQARKNSHFQHSTPEQSVNSSQKSAKSSSRQNLSLADFITIDTRSSKKSGKKSNQKTPLLRHSRDDEIVSKPTPFLTDESFPEVGQSFEKRRRIKPTKLEISDDKGKIQYSLFPIYAKSSFFLFLTPKRSLFREFFLNIT